MFNFILNEYLYIQNISIIYVLKCFCDNYMSIKISKNFISILFCTYLFINILYNCIYLNNIFLLTDFTKNVIISYFCYDIIRILINEKIKDNISYLIHHINTILFLNLEQSIFHNNEIIFLAEMSNYPMYITYHFIKKNNKKQIIIWNNIQILIYIPIRIGIFGYYLYEIFITCYNNIYYLLFWFLIGPIMYVMGFIWSIKLINDKKNKFINCNIL